MAIIALKSQFVSLIITIISFFAETLFLSALHKAGNLRDFQNLSKTKSVNIRNHQRRSLALTTASVLLFFILEIIVSFFTDPATLDRFRSSPCIGIDIISRTPQDQAQFREADIVESACQVQRKNFNLQRAGNVSLQNGDVRCSKKAVYRTDFIVLSETRKLPESGVHMGCMSDDFCVFCFQQGNFTFLSEPFLRDMESGLRSGEIDIELEYLKTELLFNSTGLLVSFAKRAADAFSQNVGDPYEIRRRAFLGSARRTCPFVSETIDATEVPTFVIVVLVVSWTFSVVWYALIAFAARNVLFEVDNLLHWALYVERREGEVVENNPTLSYFKEDNHPVVCISEAKSK